MRQKFIFMLPVNIDVMFSNHKGRYKKKIEKRQRKLIRKVIFIKPFLKEDENILLVTTGYSLLATLEQMMSGWLFVYLKRSLFVFTDRRIFHIPTTPAYNYRNSIAQLLYSPFHVIYLKGKMLVAECRICGQRAKYMGISSKETRKIKSILNTVSVKGECGNPELDRANLCPRCTKELITDEYKCNHCDLEFKDKKTARLLSIFLPGGGYFYVRQYFLGVINVILEIALSVYIILACLNIKNGIKTEIVYIVLAAIALLYEKIVSVYHSNHFIDEFIPKFKHVKASTKRVKGVETITAGDG